MKLKPIGVIQSPYKKREDAPRQGRYSEKLSKIIVFEEYKDAMDCMENNKYFFIFYWLDQLIEIN